MMMMLTMTMTMMTMTNDDDDDERVTVFLAGVHGVTLQNEDSTEMLFPYCLQTLLFIFGVSFFPHLGKNTFRVLICCETFCFFKGTNMQWNANMKCLELQSFANQ